MRTSAKKPATAARSASRSSTQPQSGGKDVNSLLMQRALDLVNEGQLTAGVAIKLFGIPRSTFYQKMRAAMTAPRSSPQPQPNSKDINSSLIQRALDLVNEGQLTAGVAIKLFGIPRSTFYGKLSMCSQQQQLTATPDTQPDQYYQMDNYQAAFGSEDFGGDAVDGSVGTSYDVDGTMATGEWGTYGDYYPA